jgi:hypothetical protein
LDAFRKKAVRSRDARLDEAVADVAHAEPAVVRAVEVDRRVGAALERVDGVVEHLEALSGCGGRVGFRRLAPFQHLGLVHVRGVRVVGVGPRVVPRDDAEAVGSSAMTTSRSPIPATTPSIQALYSAIVVAPPAEYCAQSRNGML